MYRRSTTLTEKEIEELYGKSVWDMTAEELMENDLVEDWVRLVELNAEYED